MNSPSCLEHWKQETSNFLDQGSGQSTKSPGVLLPGITKTHIHHGSARFTLNRSACRTNLCNQKATATEAGTIPSHHPRHRLRVVQTSLGQPLHLDFSGLCNVVQTSGQPLALRRQPATPSPGSWPPPPLGQIGTARVASRSCQGSAPSASG